MTRVCILIAAFLTGCADAPPALVAGNIMPSGAAAAAPAGWIDYCRRHAADPACGPV